MKVQSIKTHLRAYSIFYRRKTTMNHAFASALAPADKFDPDLISAAIRLLDQDPTGDLDCVYCRQPAKTWDHLVGLVKNSKLFGFGHQIGNLVPSCKECNSKKGNRDWREFLKEVISNPKCRSVVEKRIGRYQATFARQIDISVLADRNEWDEYQRLLDQIFDLMRKADQLADKLRLDLTKGITIKAQGR